MELQKSNIFCHGSLLEAAQNAYIYNDSKSFVDMKLKQDPNEVLAAFDQLVLSNGGNLTDDMIKEFVHSKFAPPGSEFDEWSPEDWIPSPSFLSTIMDVKLREWAVDLNNLWKVLGRKINEDVSLQPSLYSMIPVSDPFVVPGGRFREIYYWDTYWVIKGLILSEMTSTIKGMLNNFLSMVEKYGFVPNGGRIYYQHRSQPPFLISMFKDYLDATGDEEFLENSMSLLEREYNFWMTSRNVSVNDYILNRYASTVNQPRPESYREDSSVIANLSTKEGAILMTHVTSACESGWDFSSRWTGGDYNRRTNIIPQLQTTEIIPVDLNSILAMNERILSEFHRRLGDEESAKRYDSLYKARTDAIEAILWNEDDGAYFDYYMPTSQQNRRYFASNVNPMWTKCYPDGIDVAKREERMFQYLKNCGVLDHPGGIPTSLYESGEQWDFPNAWPPLVHMIIEGMSTSSLSFIRDEAFTQAQKWIRGNYKAYNQTKAMFEKYNVTASNGLPGSGGEYDVQKGFGWTNGVVLSLLNKYGDRITAEEPLGQPTVTAAPPVMTTSGSPAKISSISGVLISVICLLFRL